jgi:hypothetical protein
MTRTEKLQLRNDKIKQAYRGMSSVREYNVQKYTHEYICEKLAAKYYLAASTIERIVTL